MLLALIVGVAIVVAALMVVLSQFGGPGGSSASGKDVGKLYSGIPQDGTTLGKSSAPVTIYLYEDFQCPICGQFSRQTFPEVVDRDEPIGVAIEGEVTKFKTDEFSPPTFDNDAQPDVQGLFGVKAGWRGQKFGVFGKVRPGFTRFTPVFDCPAIDFSTCTFERHTTFSLDAGGVVEGYVSRHILVRGDIGGTYLSHPDTTRFFPGEPGIPQGLRHRDDQK